MICKNCGKQLQNSKIEKCPHCNSETGFVATGNGFYDILAQNVSVASSGASSAPSGDGPAAKETLNIAKRTANQAARNEWFIKVGLLASAVSLVLIIVVLILTIALRPGLKESDLDDIESIISDRSGSNLVDLSDENGVINNGETETKPVSKDEPLFVIPINEVYSASENNVNKNNVDELEFRAESGDEEEKKPLIATYEGDKILVYGDLQRGHKNLVLGWATEDKNAEDLFNKYKDEGHVSFEIEENNLIIRGKPLEQVTASPEVDDNKVNITINLGEKVDNASLTAYIGEGADGIEATPGDGNFSITVEKEIFENNTATLNVMVTQLNDNVKIVRTSEEITVELK